MIWVVKTQQNSNKIDMTNVVLKPNMHVYCSPCLWHPFTHHCHSFYIHYLVTVLWGTVFMISKIQLSFIMLDVGRLGSGLESTPGLIVVRCHCAEFCRYRVPSSWQLYVQVVFFIEHMIRNQPIRILLCLNVLGSELPSCTQPTTWAYPSVQSKIRRRCLVKVVVCMQSQDLLSIRCRGCSSSVSEYSKNIASPFK